MLKIKEAVKCVPVILGYFLLTEFGKMIEFWIFMAHQTESDPGQNRTVVYCIDSGCALYVSSWERLSCGTAKKDSGNTTKKLEKNITSGNTDLGCNIGDVVYQIFGSHRLCYIHERYLFLSQRNRCTCRNTDN